MGTDHPKNRRPSHAKRRAAGAGSLENGLDHHWITHGSLLDHPLQHHTSGAAIQLFKICCNLENTFVTAMGKIVRFSRGAAQPVRVVAFTVLLVLLLLLLLLLLFLSLWLLLMTSPKRQSTSYHAQCIHVSTYSSSGVAALKNKTQHQQFTSQI